MRIWCNLYWPGFYRFYLQNHVYLVFLSKDFSGDGSISIEEFAKLVASPKLQFWISSLDDLDEFNKCMFHLLQLEIEMYCLILFIYRNLINVCVVR